MGNIKPIQAPQKSIWINCPGCHRTNHKAQLGLNTCVYCSCVFEVYKADARGWHRVTLVEESPILQRVKCPYCHRQTRPKKMGLNQCAHCDGWYDYS